MFPQLRIWIRGCSGETAFGNGDWPWNSASIDVRERRWGQICNKFVRGCEFQFDLDADLDVDLGIDLDAALDLDMYLDVDVYI